MAILLRLIATAFIASVSTAAMAVGISPQDAAALTEKINQESKSVVLEILTRNGIEQLDVTTTSYITFDREKLAADYDKFRAEIASERAKDIQEFENRAKKLVETFSKNKEIPNQPASPSKNLEGLSFGELNISVSQKALTNVLADPPPPAPIEEKPVALSLQIPDNSTKTERPFVFHAEDYIKAIKITVLILKTTDVIKKEIDEKLGKRFGELQPGAKTSVSLLEKLPPTPPAPPPPPEVKIYKPQDYVQNVWDPRNTILPTVVQTAVLSLVLLIAAVLTSSGLRKLSRSFSKVQVDIPQISEVASTLAENKESDKEDASAETADASSDSVVMNVDTENYREEFAGYLQTKGEYLAPVLLELIYTKSSGSLRALTNFIGYFKMRPLLQCFPRDVLETFDEYCRANAQAATSIVDGIQTLQGAVQAALQLEEDLGKIGGPGKELLKVITNLADSQLVANLPKMNSKDRALVYSLLCTNRSDAIFSELPGEILQQTLAEMRGKTWREEDYTSCLKNLKEAGSQETTLDTFQKSVLRLASSLPTNRDAEILAILNGSESRAFLKLLFTKRIFIRDLDRIPEVHLKKAFEQIPLAKKVPLLTSLPANIRQNLVNTYEKGTKMRDLFDYELQNLDQSKSDANTAANEAAVANYLDRLKRNFAQNSSSFDEVFAILYPTNAGQRAA